LLIWLLERSTSLESERRVLGVQGAEAEALVNQGTFILLNFNQEFQVRGVVHCALNFHDMYYGFVYLPSQL